MPSLSSSIVNQHVASVRDVEEALSRQALYGGDLITNLLELAAVSEERLTRVLAESHDLEAAPVGALPKAPDAVRRVLPGDLAQRFAMYPLEERAGTLVVAVPEPLPAETEQDLSFSLGVTLVQRVALLVRVREAIARDYGAPLDRRSLRVLARLSGKPDPSPSSLPSRVEPRPIERPPETVLPDAPNTSKAAASAMPSTLPRMPRLPAVPDLRGFARPAARSSKRRLGPYTVAMAERGLNDAEARDDILRAFFDFASQYFDYAALFAVHGDLAEGRDAAGAGASQALVQAVGVPLDLPSTMSRVRDSARYELTRLGTGGLDAALSKDLDRRPGRVVLFLPVQVRGRTVLILYGDHGERDVELAEVGDVISFTPLVAAAFERLILRRRMREKGGEVSPSQGAALPLENMRLARRREPAQPLPSASERAATLASLLAERTESESHPNAPQPSSPPSNAPQPSSPGFAADDASPITPRVYPPAAPTVVQRMVSVGPVFPLLTSDNDRPSERAVSDEPSEPPPEEDWDIAPSRSGFTNVERGTKPGGVGRSPVPERAREPSPDAPEILVHELSAEALDIDIEGLGEAPDHDDEVRDAEPRTSNLRIDPPLPPNSGGDASTVDATASGTDIEASASDAGRAPPANEAAMSEGRQDEAFELTSPSSSEAEPTSEGGVPLAPASRALAYSARPPPPREVVQEEQLPSVIVDVARDTNELVRRLLRGDANAGDQLLQIGDAAITVLAGIFPGPITAELRRTSGDGPGKASECGPVLRTLARMGNRAVPFISVRTADGDPAVRAWATRLLGEMPCGESSLVVVRRLVDEDAEVRRAAMAAGQMLLNNAEAAEALQARIAEAVSDVTRPEPHRHSLIEALAELRAQRVVPALMRLLEDGSPDVVRSAHWALGVITRQDFGLRAAAGWEEWWRNNGKRHRVEWLIDALTHESQDIRRAAGDELKNLTKEYFGYYDDLPKKERERAQDRYRKWWESRGKTRFR